MNKYIIEEVLPHTAPMILIDTLIDYSKEDARCQVKITIQSPFYDPVNRGVPSYIGCEYMAQAIAAFAGARALDDNGAIAIGFLLGARKYNAFQPFFPLGETLNITIKELYQEETGLSVFECNITDTSTKQFAQANINVFQPRDPVAFITEMNTK